MTLSNLLSGVIGAVLGGVLALAASVITMRQQRLLAREASEEAWRQTQLSASHAASAKILSEMLIIKQSMWNAKESSAPKDQMLSTVYTAAERILVHSARITDRDLRSVINELSEIINQWYEYIYQSRGILVSEELYNLIIPYMEYTDKSIRAHINSEPPPPHKAPLDLRAGDDARGASFSVDSATEGPKV